MKKISTGWFKLGAAIAVVAACYWYPIVWQAAGCAALLLFFVKLVPRAPKSGPNVSDTYYESVNEYNFYNSSSKDH